MPGADCVGEFGVVAALTGLVEHDFAERFLPVCGDGEVDARPGCANVACAGEVGLGGWDIERKREGRPAADLGVIEERTMTGISLSAHSRK